jgi:hypothetical protein
MAVKLKSAAITPADLEREISHVAKNLALNSVEHAGLYVDPVQRKQRRFDIFRATHIVGHNTIELAIVPRADNEASHSYLYAFQRTKWAQSLASISEMVDRAVKQFLIRRPYVPKRAFLAVLGVPDGALRGAKYSSNGTTQGEPTQEDETMYRNYA